MNVTSTPDPAGPSVAPVQAEALPVYVAALLGPEAYPHPADDLRVHETHISWVILAGPYAYKIKKPVNFGFLDFSTVERRAAVCADEVRLNRRLCPDVYLGVVHVVEGDGGYGIGGPGRPVEPAVQMRRLPADGMLTALLETGGVDAALVGRIARHLARFHATAATGPGVDEYGSLPTLRANWQENFSQTAPFVGRTLEPSVLETIRAYVEHFLDEHAALFERRVAAGRVREGHGDLHAASICVEGGRLHLFDCLEFTPRFRCADVAAEVAFLAMDLDHYGRADLGKAFVDAYVAASGDQKVRTLLRFYKCYRAYVRAKVLSLRLSEPGLSPEREAEIVAPTRAYFDLAWAYAGGLARPTLIVTMGLTASGKTSLARALAGRLGLVQLSSDVVRKELAGLRPTDRRPDAYGQGLYDPAMTAWTYTELRRRAARWLRGGHGVILDATFGQVTERAATRRLAARMGARLVVFVCRADEATLRARLAARATDRHTESDARLEIWPALRAAFVEPAELPEAISIHTNEPPAAIAKLAIAALHEAAVTQPPPG